MITYIIVGIIVGAITGMTGASGILVIIPIFTTFFNIPLPIVLGTSLFVDVIASITVSFSYYRAKHIEIRKASWLIVGSILGAQVGSYFVVVVSKIFILVFLAISMIVFGIKMYRNGLSTKDERQLTVPEKISNQFKKPIGMILLGLLVGLITGIFGAGGGLFIFIILYSVLRFGIKEAIGTSSFVMLLTAFSGVLGYAQNGNIDLKLGVVIGLSAALGGVLTSVFANRIRDKILSQIVGVFFIFFAIIMIVSKVLPLL